MSRFKPYAKVFVRLLLLISTLVSLAKPKIIPISESKTKSFSLKRVLVDVDSSSLLSKVVETDIGLDRILKRLKTNGIFESKLEMGKFNATFWLLQPWYRGRTWVVITCKAGECLSKCSELGGMY